MQLIDVALFLLVFVICYAVLAVFVKIVHAITKDHSRSHAYRIAIIIFSLLFASMVTYNNLGRSGSKKYPRILQRLTTPTPKPSSTPKSSPSSTPTITPEVSPTS